jgi:hypothetical protein
MTTTKPSQAYLKKYLEHRHKSQNPPPTPEQIRRELGWHLITR